MYPSMEISSAVASFWDGPLPTHPPYDIITAISWAINAGVERLSRLTVTRAATWMQQIGLSYSPNTTERPLYGCLVAHRGAGYILLDADASEDEQQFTAAHEVGHFLLDYQTPRQRAIARLGSKVIAVLDGERHALLAERQQAVLADIQLGTYFTLIERPSNGAMSLTAHHIEDRADHFALELLAPAEQVIAILPTHLPRFADRLAATTDLLTNSYALPASIAADYARRLLNSLGSDTTFFEHLFGLFSTLALAAADLTLRQANMCSC